MQTKWCARSLMCLSYNMTFLI